MTNDRLLWGYPVQWRERYGAELVALVEDVADGRRPSLQTRISLVASGLKERLREQAIIGHDRPPAERVRAGARLTLIAWSVLVVAGCGYAKTSEHWQSSVPAHDQLVPRLMYWTVVGLAVLGALALLGVIATALPSLRRALSSGQWSALRRPILRAVGLSSLVGAASVALILAARHLTSAQRNGASLIYLVAFACWVLLIVAMIAAWASAALAAERRIDVTPSLARAMRIGSSVVALCTVLIAASILTWWIALARSAPWALAGHQLGTAASPWSWPIPAVAGVAVTAAAVAVLGATRLSSAVRANRHPTHLV